MSETDLRLLRDVPILVACDGDRSQLPALEAAHELSKRTKAPVRVVAVLEASPMFVYEYGAIAAMPELMDGAREQVLIRVKELVMEVAGSGAEWAIDVPTNWWPQAGQFAARREAPSRSAIAHDHGARRLELAKRA